MVIHVDEHWWWWILLSSRRRRDMPGYALLLPGRYFASFSMAGTLPGRYFASFSMTAVNQRILHCVQYGRNITRQILRYAQYDSSQSADTSLRSVWQEHCPADTSLSLSMTQQSISRYFTAFSMTAIFHHLKISTLHSCCLLMLLSYFFSILLFLSPWQWHVL